MKVILLGKGKMLANLIESAIETGVEIAGVFRYERTTLTAFQLLLHDFFRTSHDLTLIKKYNLPEIKCRSVNSKNFKENVLKNNIDLILVGTWREKLDNAVIKLPKIGTVNLHPSLLPKYRGANPYMQVIKNRETKTGVTLHLMDENFDTGAILLQKEVDIYPSDTGVEVRERIFSATRDLTSKFLIEIQNEIIVPVKQNEARATYFKNISDEEKMLDFTQKTAEEMSAHIRALHPWLPCYITLGKRFLKVNPYKLEILIPQKLKPESAGKIIAKDTQTQSLSIICSDGKILKMSGVRLYGIFTKPFSKLLTELLIKS